MGQQGRRARRPLPGYAKVALAVGAPVVFLALVELVLFVGGLRPREPEALYEPLPLRKPRGTVRIVVLGGSAAAGYPFAPRGGPAPFLRELLRDVAPGQPTEVFNCAVNALTSEGVLIVAEQVLDYDPDVLIVYSGHNEFFNFPDVNRRLREWEPRRPPWYRRTRLFALGQDMAALVRGGPPVERDGPATRVEMARAGQLGSPADYQPDTLAAPFEQRLRQLVAMARERGVAVVLSTVPSNLLDVPPTKPVHRPGLAAEQLAAWQEHYEAGREHAKAGRLDQALAAFEQAAAIDGDHAGLLFELGRAHYALEHYDEAKAFLARARDHDYMVMRTTSQRNQAVQRVAEEADAALADVLAAFEDASPHGIVDGELLCDHVHLNLAGALRAAQCWARALEGAGLLGDEAGWDWPRARPAEAYEQALGLDPAWQAEAHLRIGRQCALAEAGGQRVAELRRRQLVEGLRALGARQIAAALRLSPGCADRLLEGLGPFVCCYVARGYLEAGEPGKAVRICEETLDAVATFALAYEVLAEAYAAHGEPRKAAEALAELAALGRASSCGGNSRKAPLRKEVAQ